jgi:antitoxin CcdA
MSRNYLSQIESGVRIPNIARLRRIADALGAELIELMGSSGREPRETAARRSTSLTLDRQLLDEARALGVNVSRAAEQGLAQAVRAARARRWRQENGPAIEDYNRFIEANGVPLSEFRKF